MFSILSPLKIVLFLGGSAAILVGGGAMSGNSNQTTDVAKKENDIAKTEKQEQKIKQSESKTKKEDALAKNPHQSSPANKEELKTKIQESINKEIAAVKDVEDAKTIIVTTKSEVDQLTKDLETLQAKITDHNQQKQKAQTAYDDSIIEKTKEETTLQELVEKLNIQNTAVQTKTQEKEDKQILATAAQKEVDNQTTKISTIKVTINEAKGAIKIVQENLQTATNKMAELNDAQTQAQDNIDQYDAQLLLSTPTAVAVGPATVSVSSSITTDPTIAAAPSSTTTPEQQKKANKLALDNAKQAVSDQEEIISVIKRQITLDQEDIDAKKITQTEEQEKLPGLTEALCQAQSILNEKEASLKLVVASKAVAQNDKENQEKKLKTQTEDSEQKQSELNAITTSAEAAKNKSNFADKTQESEGKSKLIETNNQLIKTKEQELESFSSQKSSFIQQQEIQELSDSE